MLTSHQPQGQTSVGSPAGASRTSDRRLETNARRLRAVEATLPSTFVLVNIPQARLWMVRDGRVEGSMRVIVGQARQPTPEMTTELTHVVLNPRWNLPQDLVRTRLASAAARSGGRSLSNAGYEVMSGWDDDATPVPAGEIDWRAVAEGRLEVPVRQKPGPANAMGSAKFVMTNDAGIYLHDSPDRHLFSRARRTLSAGCVRVEDYGRLVNFLIRHPLPPVPEAGRPTYVRLGEPMPIYLTYITALSSDTGPMLFPDPYGLDI
ncbi:MAG: L,D-transpeptidase family protein [Alphaproteobacteria bacterium]|nr:L,D-transpeptidase family protein [Alphaproteobacteria bacterium]MBU2418473.1 L,D-transpeptidase family protein [Alphaproteobacteria bacterium]